jgi:hypothetical protein
MNQLRPVTLRGHLTEFGTTSLVFGSQPDGGISPACGCQIPPVNEWRGITFASREVTITRRSPAPWTAYQITLPDPDTITALGEDAFLQGTVLRARVNGSRNDPALATWLLKGHGPLTITQRRSVVDNIVQIVTRRPLHVALFGPVPIGAWIPLPGSRVVLSSVADTTFDTGVPQALLAETYTHTEGVGSSNVEAQQQGYPVADFVGPQLVVWTDDPLASVPVGGLVPARASSPAVGAGAADTVTALVISGGDYAARVVVTPLSARDYHDLIPALRGYQGAAGRYVIAPPLDDGTIHLSENAPLSAAAYQQLRVAAASAGITAVKLRSDLEGAGNSSPGTPINRYSASDDIPETFGYPPLPPHGGFNVFGPLDSLGFSNARGAVSASGRDIPLEGTAAVSLTDVSGFADSRTHQPLIQVPLDTTQADANLNFTAAAKLTVDDVPETLRAANYEGFLTGAIDYVAVVSLLVGLVGLWFAVRADRRAEAPGSTPPPPPTPPPDPIEPGESSG